MENGRSLAARVSTRGTIGYQHEENAHDSQGFAYHEQKPSTQHMRQRSGEGRTEVRVKDTRDGRVTSREFIRECGPTPSDENHSREAPYVG